MMQAMYVKFPYTPKKVEASLPLANPAPIIVPTIVKEIFKMVTKEWVKFAVFFITKCV